MSYLANYLAKREVVSSLSAAPAPRTRGDEASTSTFDELTAKSAKSLSALLALPGLRAPEHEESPGAHGPHAAESAKSTEVLEVQRLRADWLVDLPIPPVLELAVDGLENAVLVDLTPRPRPSCFRASEWLALSSTAAAERAYRRDLEAWVRQKHERPQWRLSALEAMGGRIYVAPPMWSVEQVLIQLDATLVWVGFR